MEELTRIKQIRIFFLLAAVTSIEKLILDAAQAMPEDKFNFSPESLNIPGSDYKGVRSFAVELKYVAASSLRTVIF